MITKMKRLMLKKTTYLLLVLILGITASAPVLAAKSAPTVIDPTVGTVDASNAVLGGNVTSSGADNSGPVPLTVVGIVWSLSSGPTVGGGGVTDVPSTPTTGIFTVDVAVNSVPGSLVYFRAYAKNNNSGPTGNYVYTTDTTFYTYPATQPVLNAFTGVGANNMTINWTASSEPAAGSIVVVSLNDNITAPTDFVDDTTYVPSTTFGGGGETAAGDEVVYYGTGNSVTVSGLSPNTLYYVAVFTYSGTGNVDPYGVRYLAPTTAIASQSTTGAATPPTVTADAATNITKDSATLGGNVTDDGGASVTARGIVWNTTDVWDTGQPPASNGTVWPIGTGTGPFSDTVSSLPSGIQIYYRAYATNSSGTAYSTNLTFTTLDIPTVTANAATVITKDSANLGGNVTDDGGASVSTRGIVWNTTDVWDTGQPPASNGTVWPIGSGTGPFSDTVDSLPSGTAIYYRAYATNSEGTGYSTNLTFTTLDVPTVTADAATDITADSATLGGNVTDDGGASVNTRGIVWNTTGVWDTAQSPASNGTVRPIGSGTGPFSDTVSSLPTDTLVYYRAYGTNSQGTGYSDELTFTPTAAADKPTVDTPTATSINYFSAVLGGTVTSDGGSTITEAGTVWGLSADPTGNKLVKDGVTVGVPFSHLRSGLPRGQTIHYRAFATNAEGTSYTTSTSFLTPTEPDVQASAVTITEANANSMRVTWTPGNGEGSLVVIRLTSIPSPTEPTDGDTYVGNPDLALAPQIGGSSGNYVIYNGVGSMAFVYGLTINTGYTITVYTYADSGGGPIDYLVPGAFASDTTSSIPVHNRDYAHNCDDCHRHSGFGARDDDQTLICESCHYDNGQASTVIGVDIDVHLTPTYPPAVDDPKRPSAMVDCGSCHETHRSSHALESTNPVDLTTDTNQKFIRSNVDKYVSGATTATAVYQTLTEHQAFDDEASVDSSKARGVCQSCHSNTKYHTHDGSSAVGGLSQENIYCHRGGQSDTCDTTLVDCVGCHTHAGNFGASGGGSCTGCHSTGKGDRRAIVGEFALATTHIADTSLTDADCEVCHAQNGTPGKTHSHMSGGVTLWNVDDHSATGYQLQPDGPEAAVDPFTNATARNELTQFCLDCHDADGAAETTATAPAEYPSVVTTPLSPFTDSGAPPVIDSTHWGGSGHDNATTPVSCVGDGTNGCHASAHGSMKLNMLAPWDSAATSPAFAEEEEGFCYTCHTTIESEFNTGTNYQTLAQRKQSPYPLINQRHDIAWADQDDATSFIECASCHDQHVNNSTNKVLNPDSGNPLLAYDHDNTNYNSDGNDHDPLHPPGYLADGSNGVAGCQTGSPDFETCGSEDFTEPDYIQFCLACHDASAASGTGPNGVTFPAGSMNVASHYLDASGDQHGKNNKDGNTGYLKYPWNTLGSSNELGGVAALPCTVCHGAHGSGNIHNLRTKITVAGVQMRVGGWGGSLIGNLDSDTYELPVFDHDNNAGTPDQQEDHWWGAWCSFCHQHQGHKEDAPVCNGAHMHGGSGF